jgi:hypothetical protein
VSDFRPAPPWIAKSRAKDQRRALTQLRCAARRLREFVREGTAIAYAIDLALKVLEGAE